MTNPWKTLSTKVVYENAWIRVREDAVIRPDGQPGIYGVEDEVYLVGQYRYALDRYSWEIIEGGSDGDESALDAAVRELREEAGIEADHWVPLGPEIHLTNCHSNERGYLFLASGLRHVGAEPDGTEQLALRKVPVAEALAMVDSGEISDAMTIMALLRLDRMRRAE